MFEGWVRTSTLTRSTRHATIAEFCKRYPDAFSGLSTPALLLGSKAGPGKLGHAAIDRTKIKANAGKREAIVRPVGF
jgi:hypothetical protein